MFETKVPSRNLDPRALFSLVSLLKTWFVGVFSFQRAAVSIRAREHDLGSPVLSSLKTQKTQDRCPKWSWTGSNRRPPACKADALPTELQPQAVHIAYPLATPAVGLGRIELPTSRLSGVRSNQLSYRPRTSCRQIHYM